MCRNRKKECLRTEQFSVESDIHTDLLLPGNRESDCGKGICPDRIKMLLIVMIANFQGKYQLRRKMSRKIKEKDLKKIDIHSG